MATLTIGASTVVFAAQSYTGQQTPVVFDVPNAAVSLRLSSTRSAWPIVGSTAQRPLGDDVINCLCEISLNGGGTWTLLVSFTASGGNQLTPSGTALTTSFASVILPARTGRQVRCSMNALHTVTTALSVLVN